jgi:predicted TIM-barrel fold metal-dependent hydrolase
LKDGFKVVDVDRHAVEPRDIWERYLAPEFRDRAPGWAEEGEAVVPVVAGAAMVRGGLPIARTVGPGPRDRFADAHAAGFSAAANLTDMDREGVDVAILSPTAGLYVIWGEEVAADLAVAIARAYNDWLADYCRTEAARLKGLALLPLQDPAAAAAELRRAVAELGFAGGIVRANPLPGRPLEADAYDPVYAAAAELGVPIAVAGGPGARLPEIGVESPVGLPGLPPLAPPLVRFDNPYARYAITSLFEQLGASLAFVGKAVLERHPGLKVVFLDGGATWTPWWLDRMDEHWENYVFGREAPTFRKPSDDFHLGAYLVARAHEGALPETVEALGDECLLWGSAYPRAELAEFPNEVESFVARADLPDLVKRRMLWDNPARVFGLEG